MPSGIVGPVKNYTSSGSDLDQSSLIKFRMVFNFRLEQTSPSHVPNCIFGVILNRQVHQDCWFPQKKHMDPTCRIALPRYIHFPCIHPSNYKNEDVTFAGMMCCLLAEKLCDAWRNRRSWIILKIASSFDDKTRTSQQCAGCYWTG